MPELWADWFYESGEKLKSQLLQRLLLALSLLVRLTLCVFSTPAGGISVNIWPAASPPAARWVHLCAGAPQRPGICSLCHLPVPLVEIDWG